MNLTDIKELLGDDVEDFEIKIKILIEDYDGLIIKETLDIVSVEEENGELVLYTY